MKKSQSKLNVRIETIRELATSELASVAGGATRALTCLCGTYAPTCQGYSNTCPPTTIH